MLSVVLASLLSLGSPMADVSVSSTVLLQERPAQTSPATALGQPTNPLPTVGDYAEREKLAGDLEEFKGGGAVGLIVLIVVVVAVLVLVSILIPW